MAFDGLKARLAHWLINYLDYWRIKDIKKSPLIDATANIAPGVTINEGVQIGRKSFVNGPGTLIDSGIIGAFCSIGDHVVIGPGEHPTEAVTTHLEWPIVNGTQWQNTKPAPVIGNDVWIGSGVTVLRGAVIEDGAVIGAGAVVTGHIPPYAIALGIPARPTRYRYENNETIEAVRATKWWEWDEDHLREAYKRFSNVSEFLSFAKLLRR